MITLALTNFNRLELLLKSFERVVYDERVDEIIISDDCSEYKYFSKLQEHIDKHMPEKVKLYRNATNLGMSRNKAKAISYAKKNEWVVIFDSDNVIDRDYIDAIHSIEKMYANTIYLPEFAMPQFDFRKFSELTVDKGNVKLWIDDDDFNMALNCCNYVVHKESYLKAYHYSPEIKASDTVYFAYHWLISGGRFKFVPDMSYTHRVHEGSGFLADADYNMKKAADIRKLIKNL